jgi:subtilisin family serine protease
LSEIGGLYTVRKVISVAAVLFIRIGIVSAAPPAGNDHVPGRLLLQARPGADSKAVDQALAGFGARKERIISQLGTLQIQVPEAAADQVAAALSRSGLFTFVERDYVAQAQQTAPTAVTPNDPDFPSEWHLAKIQSPYAWSITTGTSGVILGIIDSGVDPNHPDLASKLVPGWNFLTGTSNTADVQGHGTAVAGAAAASTNNGMGVSGVAWSNKIMPLVAVDSTLYASYSNLASAITYAADNGVRIIVITAAGSTASSTLQSAVDYAWSKGAVIFASAGNNSTSAPYYPAACNHVVAVSATDQNDNLTSFSDYGSWIDLSAPGINIYTTELGGGYWVCWGTSFSAPIAASVAALALSRQPTLTNSALVSLMEQNADDIGAAGWDQYYGYGRVNAYRTVTAASSTSLSDITPPSVSISSPLSGSTVSGTIQIQGSATDNVGVTNVAFYVDSQQIAQTATSSYSFSWNSTSVANGSHSITIKASDAAGNIGTASVTVTVQNASVKDTQAPVVTVTSPTNGAKITALSLQIAVSATDNVGVTQVAIYVDGVLRCTDAVSPFTCTWNTKKASSGSHVISAKGWDAAGNVGSATPVTVYK